MSTYLHSIPAFVVFVSFLCCGAFCDAQAIEEHARAGWVSLFDGETLNGWRGYRSDRSDQHDVTGWSVADGLLQSRNASPQLDLLTEDVYENYELVVQWKTEAGGNSGVFVHADESTKTPALNAPEIQLRADGHEAGDLYWQAGAICGLYPAIRESIKPAGKWNHTRVVADGSRLAVWHNGTAICDCVIGGGEWNGKVAAGKFAESPNFAKRLKGHIGLQNNGQKVWFRSVKIRKIEVGDSAKPKKEDYPQYIKRITYRSDADQTDQPALFYAPESQTEPVPLLVALHSWSGGYEQRGAQVAFSKWCHEQGWVFIHPHFRGPNWMPDSLGSELVVGDILSAVEYAKKVAHVDPERIYCVGVSGGGHASMLMAARAPELWAAVSAWCGISDLERWHRQCEGTRFERYAKHIEQVLGGRPESSADALNRSPIHWLSKNRERLPILDLWHGVNDGRAGSVPFVHSLRAWNAAVPEEMRMKEPFLENAYQTQTFPIIAPSEASGRQILFRKKYENARVSVFDGGHEILPESAFNWLAAQRRGEEPNWNPKPVVAAGASPVKTESGK